MDHFRKCLWVLGVVATTNLGAQSTTATPAPPKVSAVTQMADVVQNPSIRYRDGGMSKEVNGISYWLFSDTAQGNYNFQDNTMASTSSLDASKGITLSEDYANSKGSLSRVITWSQDELDWMAAHKVSDSTCPAGIHCGASLAIWPQTFTKGPTPGTVLVGFNEIERGGDIEGYPTVGSGLALGSVGQDGWLHFTRPQQGSTANHPTLMWGSNGLSFTNIAFVYGGYYYAYANSAYFAQRLARVPIDDVFNQSAWTYYAGAGTWSSNVSDCVALFVGGGAGQVFFNHYLNQWVTLYLEYGNNKIDARVANAPEGPWSKAVTIATAPLQYRYGYIAHGHIEFAENSGQSVYLTYSTNTTTPLWKITFTK